MRLAKLQFVDHRAPVHHGCAEHERVPLALLPAEVRGFEPGRKVEVSFFRRDVLRHVTLKLAKRYELEYAVEQVEKPDKRQLRLREGWLGKQ